MSLEGLCMYLRVYIYPGVMGMPICSFDRCFQRICQGALQAESHQQRREYPYYTPLPILCIFLPWTLVILAVVVTLHRVPWGKWRPFVVSWPLSFLDEVPVQAIGPLPSGQRVLEGRVVGWLSRKLVTGRGSEGSSGALATFCIFSGCADL